MHVCGSFLIHEWPGLEDTVGQHSIGNLEEAGNVGACLQVRVVLLGSLHAPAGHMAHTRAVNTPGRYLSSNDVPAQVCS